MRHKKKLLNKHDVHMTIVQLVCQSRQQILTVKFDYY